MSHLSKMARYAERYAEIGLSIVPTAPGKKYPCHRGWNLPENAITTPEAAHDHWSKNPTHGIAMLLAPSGLVALDIDDQPNAPTVLAPRGIDLDALRVNSPCVVGRNYQLLFTAPDAPLKHNSAAWPTKDNPLKSAVLFELRAGNICVTVPPTIHPGTGKPYRWENPPRDGFPPLPAKLRALSQDWPTFQREALALCPWAPPPKEKPQPKTRTNQEPRDSVIHAFNAAHDVTAILEAHGYQRRDKRFASPETAHAAGVVLLESGRVFCHHQGDVLSGDHSHDAFDCFRILAHGGDFRLAVRAAAQSLGLNQVST